MEPEDNVERLRIVYLEAKKVHWVLENPTSSLLFRYRCIRDTGHETNVFLT